ncbi:MAG: hypothetical protein ACU843_08015 [Gammaproteobacteria bacterium]
MSPETDCCTLFDVGGARAVQVVCEQGLGEAIGLLGLESRAVLVLVGGAASLGPKPEQGFLRSLFFDVLAPLAESLQAIVIDGGTDSGVMQLMGAARSEIGGTFPLLGVAAIDTVRFPDEPGFEGGTALLEPHHSHYLIVPGKRWGDESPWIARVASLLSAERASVTVVVNGGEITLRDISFSIDEGRAVFVFSGSGRLADRIAGALAAHNPDPEISELVSSGLVQALEIDCGQAEISRILRSCLGA